jgi:hypothetical protein
MMSPPSARGKRSVAEDRTNPHPNPVQVLAQDLDIRIIDAATGELLRELVLDTTKRYQPTGRPPGPPRKNHNR